MEVKVVVRGVEETASLRTFAEEKIATGLARFESHVLSATVRLEDETGAAKGGVDKLCSIEVKLRRGEVRIKERGDDFLATINVAIDRVKSALAREAAKTKRGVGRR
jgi:ribosomal subunit interface protein